MSKRRSRKRPIVVRFDEIEGVSCPCGTARRAFLVPGNEAASVHQVQISKDAERHYHNRLTEIYIVLEGRGTLELDEDRVPLRPGTAVLIPPGVVHRAVGKLKILNVSVPPFDPGDEHVVLESARRRRSAGRRREAGDRRRGSHARRRLEIEPVMSPGGPVPASRRSPQSSGASAGDSHNDAASRIGRQIRTRRRSS